MANFLVIDDDMSFAMSVLDVLRNHGYHVGVARSILCELSAIEPVEADVFIVDMSMSAVEPSQVISALRRDNSTIPCVAVSSTASRKAASTEPGFSGAT